MSEICRFACRTSHKFVFLALINHDFFVIFLIITLTTHQLQLKWRLCLPRRGWGWRFISWWILIAFAQRL